MCEFFLATNRRLFLHEVHDQFPPEITCFDLLKIIQNLTMNYIYLYSKAKFIHSTRWTSIKTACKFRIGFDCDYASKHIFGR